MPPGGFQPKADEPMIRAEFLNIKHKVENILVVRQHNQIGDMLCSLTLYAALKKKFPDSKITLVVAKTNYAIPFRDLNPFLDRIIIFNKQNIRSLLNFLQELRKSKYEIGIVPSTIKISRTSHIINFLAGAKIRVGVRSINGIKNNSHKWLNIKSDFNWNNTHQLDRNLDVVKQIDCCLTDEEKASLKFSYSDEDKTFAKYFIKENYPDEKKKIIGFHPGAGKTDNMWSTINFTELIKRIYKKHNNYILLTSGWIDEKTINKIESELNILGIKYKTLSDLPLKKLAAILSLISLFITNDTGTMHIAGSTTTNMISLFGPTNPLEWAPHGENKYYIKSKTGYINDISVDEVYNLAEKILEVNK